MLEQLAHRELRVTLERLGVRALPVRPDALVLSVPPVNKAFRAPPGHAGIRAPRETQARRERPVRRA